jgi:pimeloyl-ACP methyl ester carboxylesterase
LLTIDAPATPHLVLLPPALGGLVELTALSANLNGRVTVSVLTLDSSQAQALTESELAALLLQALWTCARRYEAGSKRALWLGGYSMGAEILAALVTRQPELLTSCERLVLLDPNPCTEVFSGDGLYTEFVSFFSSLAERLQSTAPLQADISVDALRRELPAVYSEWRYYELQHQLLAGTTFEERITTPPLLDFPLTLFFSDDAPAASVEVLQHRLARNARIHRRRGDHVAFIGVLRAEDFLEADASRRAALYPQPATTGHSTAAPPY